jgi:ADP-ribose pyrophosphatase YjhB (NUDIX family)
VEPPGGVLELDETFEAGVRREVAEEVPCGSSTP